MKTLYFPLLVEAGLLAGTSALSAAPIPALSEPIAVTVYLDRAIISRVARIDLPAGQSEVVFERLPPGLIDASLQVSARGTAVATILDASARVTHIDSSPNPRVKAMEEELAGLRRQDAELAGKLALIDQQKALLNRIEGAMTAPPPRDATAAGPRPSFEDWQKLLAFQAENLTRLNADHQALTKQREELAAKIAAADAQINTFRVQQRGPRSFKTVAIRVAATQPGTLEVNLAYAVPGASWSPAYDARLRSEQRAIELTYYGVVRNGTGEDWKNLALTLSTARPSQGGGAPELSPWIVDVFRPMPMPMAASGFDARSNKAVGGARGRTAAMASAPEMAADSAQVQEATVSQATLETGATSATFKIATPVTLASDNTTQKVAITSTKLNAALRYESTPRLIEAAFLSASVSNSSEFPLLAGPVNTFLDETFVATSQLKTVMPNERFDLSLGADDGIAVKRRLVNRFTEDTGLTSKGRRVTYEFLVTLTNNKKTTERVVMKDTIPISRDEKIVVKLLVPAERDIGAMEGQKEITREPEGRLVWRIDLKPGEKREIPLKLSVEHPSDVAVSGLE